MKNWMFLLLVFPVLKGFSQTVPFPRSHLGTWTGTLHMEPSGMEISMSLQLGPALSGDSVFAYTLTYKGPKEDDVREYILRVTDITHGIFSVDEKNSIILTERLLGNKLSSIFTVEGSTLLITLELHPAEIIFEVFSWQADAHKPVAARKTCPLCILLWPTATNGPC